MSRKRRPHPRDIEKFVYSMLDEDIHAKRIASIANATIGIIATCSLAIHAIGRGLAAAKGLVERHTTKQVDRLIGNKKLDLDDLFDLWVPLRPSRTQGGHDRSRLDRVRRR